MTALATCPVLASHQGALYFQREKRDKEEREREEREREERKRKKERKKERERREKTNIIIKEKESGG